MSRQRGRRGALVVATMLAAAMALAGCSSGMVTQTDTQLSQAPGSFGAAGEIVMRDMVIDAGPTEVVAAGAGAELRGTIVNEGALPDRLVSVTSPFALQVELEGPTTIPGNNALRLLGAQPGAVGPAQPDNVTPASARATMQGATQVLRPGPTYTMVFTFERSGPVTVPIVAVGAGPSAG